MSASQLSEPTRVTMAQQLRPYDGGALSAIATPNGVLLTLGAVAAGTVPNSANAAYQLYRAEVYGGVAGELQPLAPLSVGADDSGPGSLSSVSFLDTTAGAGYTYDYAASLENGA